MIQGRAFPQCLHEIKENCQPLHNTQYSSKKSLVHQIDQIAEKIPILKNIHQIRQEQEQKIYQNIHKVNNLSLMQEIGKVNPNLQKELQLIRNDQLSIKFAQYQQQQELNTETLSDNYTQQSVLTYPIFDHFGSGIKLQNRPLIRNIMDDYNQDNSDYSDSYINKYLDLN